MKDLCKILSSLDELDLECIKVKLMNTEDGPGWSPEQADVVEKHYKRFLFLSATSEAPIVPTTLIDKFWHFHILDTRKYAKDCQQIFGYFLHHFPYLGLRDAEDAKCLQDVFKDSCLLYESVFGEPYPDEKVANCTSPKCRTCCSIGGSIGISYNIEDIIQEARRPTFNAFNSSQ